MEINRFKSAWLHSDLATGIVHIGLGAFMRAHMAMYNEILFDLDPASRQWGICAVNVRSNSEIIATLQEQGLHYNVAEYEDVRTLTLREIASISELIYAGADSSALLMRMQDPAVKIVSLTVTEKGYYLNPSDRRLQLDDPMIMHDLEQPLTPRSVPGILCAALKSRMQLGMAPFTLLSCDNMPANGKSLEASLLQFARASNAELHDWIAANVRFPSTMVDRIVPAMTEQGLQDLNDALQLCDEDYRQDRAGVRCEAFSQWVIEDSFNCGRPDWDKAGARFVQDVEPFETMKLRMLNGSHSLLAYLGSLAGLTTVSQCVADSDYRALLQHYLLQEAAPTLHMPAGEDLRGYAASLMHRFANDSLQHKTAQIAMDGSLKIPQRWLAGADILLAQEKKALVTALGLAAWMRYASGCDDKGNTFVVDDPMAALLREIAQRRLEPLQHIRAFLQTPVFAASSIATNAGMVELIRRFYAQLEHQGARQTVHSLVTSL